VVPPDHGLRGGAAGGSCRPDRLARARPGHAAQLDRKSVGRRWTFPLGSGGSLRIFTTRPDTLYGATSWCSHRSTRWPPPRGRDHPGAGGGRVSWPACAAPTGERRMPRGEGGGVHGAWAVKPDDAGADSDLGGKLRPDGVRDRRHHGGAAHDRATSTSLASTTCIRVVIQPRASRCRARAARGGYEGEERMVASGPSPAVQ